MQRHLPGVLFGILMLVPAILHAAPTSTGSSGLFELVTAETLPKGKFNVGLYADKYDRHVIIPGATLNTPGLPSKLPPRDMGLDDYYFSLAAAYGITDWFELGLAVPYKMSFGNTPFEGFSLKPYIWSDTVADRYAEAGIGDPILTMKFRFWESKVKRIALAAIIEAKGPVADADKGLGTGKFDGGLKLAFSKNWNRVGIHLSAGYFYVGEPDAQENSTKDGDYVSNSLYGGLGFDFCPFRANNFKLILEFEGNNGSYDQYPNARYLNDRLDAVLGFRYFFSPKKWSAEERMSKYSWALGAGVRYQILEQIGKDDTFSPELPTDGPNPWGFVAHVSWSPRLRSDICIIKPRNPRKLPPTVTVSADPASWVVEVDRLQMDGNIAPKKLEDGNMQYVTSRISALARDPDGDSKKITYAWTYKVGDLNETYQVLDGDGKPVVTEEFDFTFTVPEPEMGVIPPYTFFVTVTDEQGLTANGQTTVTLTVTKPTSGMISIDPVLFAFDRPRKEGMSAITEAYRKQVDEQVIKLMQENETITIRLLGLTCPIGTTEYNLALGERRAQAVYDYLTTLGISGFRLERVSYGEEERYLVVPCTVPNCIQQKDQLSPNRRTEFVITGGVPPALNINPKNLSEDLQQQRKESGK